VIGQDIEEIALETLPNGKESGVIHKSLVVKVAPTIRIAFQQPGYIRVLCLLSELQTHNPDRQDCLMEPVNQADNGEEELL
jgi:hypothetical protein